MSRVKENTILIVVVVVVVLVYIVRRSVRFLVILSRRTYMYDILKKKKKKERNVVRNVRTIVQKKRIYGLWRWAKMAQVYRVVLCITMRDGATKSLVVVCKYAI